MQSLPRRKKNRAKQLEDELYSKFLYYSIPDPASGPHAQGAFFWRMAIDHVSAR